MDRFEPEHWPRFVRFPAFTRDWERLGLDEDDLRALELEILSDPTRAPVIRGTDGLRKLRYAGPRSGRGKSGAYRVCYADFPEHGTVAMVVVFGKNEKHDLGAADREAVASVLGRFRDELRREAARGGPPAGAGAGGRAMGKASGAKAKRAAGRRKGGGATAGRELTPAGSKIVAAFEEAIEEMRSGEPLERRFTVRTYKVDFTPRSYGPDDVRRVRGLLGMSQAVFAGFLGVDANTVRSWEQGLRPPSGVARRFMDEIEASPEHWRRRLEEGVDRSEATG